MHKLCVKFNMNYFLILFLLIFLAGCAPIPNVRYIAPEIKGTIVRDGVAISDKIISHNIDMNTNCSSTAEQTNTDTNGQFTIEAVTRFHLIKLLLGHPITNWTICMLDNEEFEILASQHATGLSPKAITLECDLDKKLQSLYDKFPYEIESICKITVDDT